jgi:hypothetical protein
MNEIVRIQLNDEMLMLLLRGGTVNSMHPGVQIRIEPENRMVIINREDYQDLKRHMNSPYILEEIHRNIAK